MRNVLAFFLLILLVLGSLPAGAQSAKINVQKFHVATSPYDIITLKTSNTLEHLQFHAGGLLGYAMDPLVFKLEGADVSDEVVSTMLGMDLYGALGLLDFIEVGLSVPVYFYIGGEDGDVVDAGDLQSFSFGDIILDTKVVAFKDIEGFGLALHLPISLPTSFEGSYVGESLITATPTAVATYSYEGLSVALNLGYMIRENNALDTLSSKDELVFGLGAAVPVMGEDLSIMGEVKVSTTLVEFFGDADTNYAELLAGARYMTEWGLTFLGGIGTGLAAGYGNPKVRLFAGVSYWPRYVPPKDADMDGLPDELDDCPTDPEDKDGFEDQDGCPEPDNDQDGVLDGLDECPTVAEDKDGFQDGDGCPDEDNDKDGILDVDDGCKDEAEDKDGFQDDDGCPDDDNDADGIPDATDACQNEPETVNGYEDQDGCPDEIPKKVIIIGKKIHIPDKVYFAKNKSTILKKSFPMLLDVAKVINDNPQVAKIRVEGHTDSSGKDSYNLKLSKQRAEAVYKFLVKKGKVSKKRLEWEGYGEEKPIADNDTEEGRAENRRVEFTILGD